MRMHDATKYSGIMSSTFKINVNKTLMMVASLQFVLLLILASLYYKGFKTIQMSPCAEHPPFDFVPAAPKSITDCDDLFGPDTAAAAFQLSSDYNVRFPAFNTAVNNASRGEILEGFTHQLPTQFKVLQYLARRPNVRRICETGFNLGHSSFGYLTANQHAIVHSFDLGNHKYSHKMATYMSRHFPQRFLLHFGDSRQTLPEFVRSHADHRCDFIYVDGGHTYPVAMADLLNMAAMANVESGNVIMFDDYPTTVAFRNTYGWAWENMRRWGYINELLRCAYKSHEFQRGFVIGKVVRRPLVYKPH